MLWIFTTIMHKGPSDYVKGEEMQMVPTVSYQYKQEEMVQTGGSGLHVASLKSQNQFNKIEIACRI